MCTTTVEIQNISITQRIYLCPFIVNPFLLPQPLETTHLICSYSFICSRMLYKWNYVVRSHPSLSILVLKFIHTGACVTSCFLFIPLYRCTKTGLPICQPRLLGCFHFGSIKNKSAKNFCKQVFTF